METEQVARLLNEDSGALVQFLRDLEEQNEQLSQQVAHLQRELAEALELSSRGAGERKTVTVLFADLRDSTAMAESLPPEKTIELLNAYLGALARSVMAHGGMVDKFMGDGLMAVFGLVDDSSAGAPEAAQAVLDMRSAVHRLNGERGARGQSQIEFGVGVHTGEVIFGAVGFPGRADYTAIGDAVNTAARLSGLCRELKTDAVLSQDTVAQLDTHEFNVRDLGHATLRGKSAPVAISMLC